MEKSNSEAEKTESEQTSSEDSGGGGQNGIHHQQTTESFEQEAEFVRADTSEAHSPLVQESAEAEGPRNAAPSPRSVRRRRAQKHAQAAAVRKAPATKNNQRGALRAFQKFWRGDPYNLEGQQEVNEKNVRTFFDEIEEERSPTIDKYVKGLQLTMRQIWAAAGKTGPEPNIRRYDEVKHRRAAAKKATAALRRKHGYDKQRDKPDRISRQDITRVVDLMTKYLCLTKEKLAEHKMTRGTLINMRADVLECIHLEEEIGPTPGYTLDIINDIGKTNENGNMEVTSVLQNKDAAMYTWKKSPGRKGEEAGYSYSTQRKYIQHFMKVLGIEHRLAESDARRPSPWCSQSRDLGVTRPDVKKYARFTTNRSDHFSRSYAQDSPMTLQFGMAGFRKEAVERNFTDGYRLARLIPTIPQELLKKFCPWVEKEYREIKQRNASATLDGDKRVTSENFFQFLACGKEVFLSSLAAMEPVYPNLCLFEDMSLFENRAWVEYKRAVQEADASPDRCLPPRQDNQSLLMTELRKHSDQLGELFRVFRDFAARREGAGVSDGSPPSPHGPPPPPRPVQRARGSAADERQPETGRAVCERGLVSTGDRFGGLTRVMSRPGDEQPGGFRAAERPGEGTSGKEPDLGSGEKGPGGRGENRLVERMGTKHRAERRECVLIRGGVQKPQMGLKVPKKWGYVLGEEAQPKATAEARRSMKKVNRSLVSRTSIRGRHAAL
ncbi:hypothetical protein KFL_003950010 [Klebsormidium nitens]|uniref:Ndc10 domain-containing protein n=1 Tax=Klebsormidium nitens TaxID=105231 RepID=A0A1Y1IAN0_KLENI|nr:hypothetical protein KFL_003950010 [Klebsormidium nitens]|eukprot:GAQ88024.1 hypothetical protein KFL_003950010 [Klebsormidium nitens]